MDASSLERLLHSHIERSLSNAWGGKVRLGLQEIIEEHPHVIRLKVYQAPEQAPSTVVVKRSRAAGQYLGGGIEESNAFFRDWANLEYLQTVMGNETVVPRIFAGSKDEGYFVMEDFGDRSPLENALWNGAIPEATQAMAQYGAMLGLLHRGTAGKIGIYNAVCDRVMVGCCLGPENFHSLFETFIANLGKLEVVFPSSALDELWEGAEILTHPARLDVFTHGDPVGGNILGIGGRWRLIDFEVGRFQNGLIEGVFPRMVFPTSGLDRVMGIPEKAWRESETEYLLKVGETIPEVQDEVVRGRAITAACAFWLLVTWDS